MRIFKSEIKEMQSDGKPEDAALPATPVASERVEPAAPAPASEQTTDTRPA
jgi:sec-independent protein translocase protein TatA